MKLGLITPKGTTFSVDPELGRFFSTLQASTADSLMMPKYAFWSGGSLGLLIVAALTPPGWEIDYVDENYEDVDFDRGYDLVGITAMTQQAPRAYGIAGEFRRRGVRVVIGGMHATVLPEEAKEHADAVVIGEAENTWPVLIDDFSKGGLKPFYKSDVPADLAKAPRPRYDLLTKYDYRMIWVQTTRGCPRDCEFCAASKIYGKAYRHKTVEQVMDELRLIRSLWSDPLINFADDNMFVNRPYARELVQQFDRVGFRWTAQSDVSVADDGALLDALRASRCIILFIGFETLSQDNRLDAHGWKQQRIHRYPEAIRTIQGKGIGVLGAFIVGLDDDDAAVFDRLAAFIIDNRLYAAQVTALTPLPGTRLRERLVRENRVLPTGWERYTFVDVNFTPRRMSPEDLKKGILAVYTRIYSKEARLAVMKHFMKIYADLNTARPWT